MNLPGPYKLLPFVLFAFMAPESAFAATDEQSRLNPFELPPGIYSQENAPQATPQTLKLQAIFTFNGKRVATISGQNFSTGDFAYGKKIVSISPNQVILDSAGRQEILLLEKTRFRIRKYNKK